MIVILLGAPGIGKTTLLGALNEQFGVPTLELSWMPEFRRMNGQEIPYEVDERIAIFGLVQLARNYLAHGHRCIILSDFRIETVPVLLEATQPEERWLIKLVTHDPDELTRRVGARTEGYRDAARALDINDWLCGTTLAGEVVLDATAKSIPMLVAEIAQILEGFRSKSGGKTQPKG